MGKSLASRWRADDRIPLFLPLHHIHGIINVQSCALWAGALVEPFPKFDLPTILPRVAEGAYTVFMAVPTIYVKLIEALQALPDDQRDDVIALCQFGQHPIRHGARLLFLFKAPPCLHVTHRLPVTWQRIGGTHCGC